MIVVKDLNENFEVNNSIIEYYKNISKNINIESLLFFESKDKFSFFIYEPDGHWSQNKEVFNLIKITQLPIDNKNKIDKLTYNYIDGDLDIVTLNDIELEFIKFI